MNEDSDIMTETPEEAAFFNSKGAETVVVEPKPEPELPLEPEAPKPVETKEPEEPAKVPLAELMEERRSRQQAQAEFKRLQKEVEELKSKIAPPQKVEKIDPNVDPIGALSTALDKLETFEKTQQTQAEINAIAQFGRAHADEFRKDNADFDDAYNHLRNARANQLVNDGMVSSPKELNERILDEEKTLIKLAADWKISPAALMYNLARSAGYTPKQAAEAAAAAPETPLPPPAPTVEEKIKMAAEGQARAANPVSKAGAGGNGKIDLKALANLDDDEFDKATSGRNWSKMWN